MNPLNTEELAKQDIIARPEVTGEGNSHDKKQKVEPQESANSAKNSALSGEVLEPDAMETAASKVLSKSIDDLREHLGAGRDGDFTTLLHEVLSGSFVAIRFMSGKPWIRFVVAGGALGVSLIPPVLRYMKTKDEKTKEESNS